MTVAEPFAKGHAESYALAAIAARFGARLVQDTVAEVAPPEQAIRTGAGKVIPYDHLVLATGARAMPAYAHAITFGEDRRGGGAARAAPRCRGGLRQARRLRRARTGRRGRCRSTSSR